MSLEPNELSTDAGDVISRIRRVLLMDAEAAMDRLVGPYARWTVAHPLLMALGNVVLGVVVVLIGWLVLHSTFLVLLGLIVAGVAALFAGASVLAALVNRLRAGR
jgi:hypothetical protein